MDGFKLIKIYTQNSYKYFRATLNESEQNLYDKLVEGFFDFSEKINVRGISIESIQAVFEKIKQDIPEVFFVENVYFKYEPFSRRGMIIPKYRFTKEQTNATIIALYQKCQRIIKNVYLSSELQKEKFIHDYFCENIVYDNNFEKSSFECVGPLLFGKGVCEGISKAAKMLFDLVGVRSIIVYGESNLRNESGCLRESHAWNIVNIEKNFYHLDITFDLTVQAFNVIRYDYFNLSDELINIDHLIHTKHVPKCKKVNSYYLKNAMFMSNQNEFKKHLIMCLKSKKKDIVFQLPIVPNIEQVKEKILEIVNISANQLHLFLLQYQLISNDTQFVFHLHFE